jgi:hypothetical protein
MISESGLIIALVRGLADEEIPVRKECLTALIHLQEFMIKHCDDLELALQPLMNIIR